MFDQTNDTNTQLTVGEITTPSGIVKKQLLRDSVLRAARNYFSQLEQQDPKEVYELFLVN